jgi:hypothetical protein
VLGDLPEGAEDEDDGHNHPEPPHARSGERGGYERHEKCEPQHRGDWARAVVVVPHGPIVHPAP